MQIQDVLVPVDFGPSSTNALEFAVSLMKRAGEIHLLHVVDAEFLARAAAEGFGEREELQRRLVTSAEARLEALAKQHSSTELSVKAVVVVGTPFIEIVKLARDLAFQMVVMGTHGRHLDNIEQALFGSTAERVLRTTQLPVVCVPFNPKAPNVAASAGVR